jgi:hypothetical protein
MIIDSHRHAGAGFGLTDFWFRRPYWKNIFIALKSQAQGVLVSPG